jgi:hypothetical protein
MNEESAIWIFYISLVFGGIGLGFGFGHIFSSGVGWLVFGSYAIASIPVGFWFAKNVDKIFED